MQLGYLTRDTRAERRLIARCTDCGAGEILYRPDETPLSDEAEAEFMLAMGCKQEPLTPEEIGSPKKGWVN
jgi:hypothetical protein